MADQIEPREPNVSVLGHEVPYRRRRRQWRRPSTLHSDVVFGMFLLFGGAILFANTLGLVSWDFWSVVARFWPLVLVLVGAQIVFARGAVGWLLMVLVSLGVLGLVTAYGLLVTGSPVAAWFPAELHALLAWFDYVIHYL